MQNPEICDCKTRLLIFGGNQYQTSNTNETTKLRSMSGITKNTEKDEKNNFFFFWWSCGDSYIHLWLDQ